MYDIRDALDQSGEKLPASISTILKEEGFARLPRRRDDERPATTRPNAADVADAGKLDLSERTFRTKVGGLFLFLPYLAKIPLDKMLADAKFPGTKMMPAAHAIRSLLAMKLFGSARHSHVMSYYDGVEIGEHFVEGQVSSSDPHDLWVQIRSDKNRREESAPWIR